MRRRDEARARGPGPRLTKTLPTFPLTEGFLRMQTEDSLQHKGVEARGALCVECLGGLDAAGGRLLDRTGAALCRACAAEFYAACAGCGGLVPRDEALARPDGGALNCFECYGRASSPDGTEALTDEEVASLVAEYVALHEEMKRLDA